MMLTTLAVVLSSLVLFLPASSADSATREPHPGPVRLMVMGDSLADEAMEYLQSLVADRGQMTIDSRLVYGGSALGAVFAGDLLTLFCYWEAMAVSSAFLVWARRTPESNGAGVRYLALHLASGLLLLAGALLIYRETGDPLVLGLHGPLDALERGPPHPLGEPHPRVPQHPGHIPPGEERGPVNKRGRIAPPEPVGRHIRAGRVREQVELRSIRACGLHVSRHGRHCRRHTR